MSDTPPNGLASLAAQRERARRSMPAPRHPVTGGDTASERAAAATDPPATDNAPPADPQPRRMTPASVETGTTFKVTLYVDQATDEYMEAVRVEGLTSHPKVDVSRSAVVRLALRRLMDDMRPGEVKTLLAGQVVRGSGPGRKRR